MRDYSPEESRRAGSTLRRVTTRLRKRGPLRARHIHAPVHKKTRPVVYNDSLVCLPRGEGEPIHRSVVRIQVPNQGSVVRTTGSDAARVCPNNKLVALQSYASLASTSPRAKGLHERGCPRFWAHIIQINLRGLRRRYGRCKALWDDSPSDST